jgi:hypothetical protein
MDVANSSHQPGTSDGLLVQARPAWLRSRCTTRWKTAVGARTLADQQWPGAILVNRPGARSSAQHGAHFAGASSKEIARPGQQCSEPVRHRRHWCRCFSALWSHAVRRCRNTRHTGSRSSWQQTAIVSVLVQMLVQLTVSGSSSSITPQLDTEWPRRTRPLFLMSEPFRR